MDEGAGLENRSGASHRGFESHPLRQPSPRLRLASQLIGQVTVRFDFPNSDIPRPQKSPLFSKEGVL